jgi:hypothetical protein
MKTKGKYLFAAIVWSILGRVPGNSEEMTKVRILVVSSFGGEVRERVRVDVRGERASKTAYVEARGFIELPPGNYLFQVSAASYERINRSVSIRGPRTDVLLALPIRVPDQLIGEGPLTPWALSGQIEPVLNNSLVLVRIVGLLLDYSTETETDKNGKFSLDVFSQGKYLLMVLSEGKVINERILVVDVSVPKALNLGIITSQARR